MENSPPEGPILCGMNISIPVVRLLLCLCGLAGNGAVFCLLGPSKHSKAITVYIFHMAITDFTCLLLAIIVNTMILLVENVSCSIIVSQQYLLFHLSLLELFSYFLGLYLLTAISFNRCRSTLCPLCCRCHHPQQQSKVVSAMLRATSSAVILTLTSLIVSNPEQQFIVTVIVMFVLNLFFFASSTVISSTYIFIKVRSSCQQQPLERLDIIIFLTVLFSLSSSIYTFLFVFRYMVYPPVLSLLLSIHLSIKPFIYFLAGRCWRHSFMGPLQLSLQRLFGEPEETTAHSYDDITDIAV